MQRLQQTKLSASNSAGRGGVMRYGSYCSFTVEEETVVGIQLWMEEAGSFRQAFSSLSQRSQNSESNCGSDHMPVRNP
jgi:hypothetical protein